MIQQLVSNRENGRNEIRGRPNAGACWKSVEGNRVEKGVAVATEE